MGSKPTTERDWTPAGPGVDVIEPGGAKKTTGWLSEERPPYQFFNWLFWIADQWSKWFKGLFEVTTYVGSSAEADYVDINTAVAASKNRIKLITDITVTVEQVFSLSDGFIDTDGFKIISATVIAGALLKVTGDHNHMNVIVESTITSGTTTDGVLLEGDNNRGEICVIQNGAGGTITNGVNISATASGNSINTCVMDEAGTITNSIVANTNFNKYELTDIVNGRIVTSGLILQRFGLFFDTKTADYVILDNDGLSVILVDTGGVDRTITLPTALDNKHRVITIKKEDLASNLVIIDGEGAETVEGFGFITLFSANMAVTLMSDGTEWHTLWANSRFVADLVVDVTTNHTVLDQDGGDILMVSDTTADRTITLPNVSVNKGRSICIKKTATQAGVVIVDGEGAETIDNLDTLTIRNENDFVTLISDGSEWQIKAQRMNGVNTVSTNYIVLDDDGVRFLYIDDTTVDRTITLPTAADNENRILSIKKIDTATGRIIIDGEGAETIEGVATQTLNNNNDIMEIICDGTGWKILSKIVAGVITVSASYSILDDDGVKTILVDDTSSDRTITLPTVADNKNREITIKNISTDKGNANVEGEAAGETIEGISGTTGIPLDSRYQTITVKSNGSVWHIIDIYLPTTKVDLVVTGTGMTDQDSHGLIFRDVAGQWYLDFTIDVAVSVASSQDYAPSIANISFANTIPVAAWARFNSNSSEGAEGVTASGSGVVNVSISGPTTIQLLGAVGTSARIAKPTNLIE